jgi:hypothetical protein
MHRAGGIGFFDAFDAFDAVAVFDAHSKEWHLLVLR